MIRKKTRMLSLMLAVALMLVLAVGASGTVLAAEDAAAAVAGAITGFELAEVNVAQGTPEAELSLPGEVTANVQPDGEDAQPATVKVGVGAWVTPLGMPAYDPANETLNIYVLEADPASLSLPEGVRLPEGVDLPCVRVTVGEFVEPTVETMAAPPGVSDSLYYNTADGRLYMEANPLVPPTWATPAQENVHYTGSYTGNGSTLTLEDFEFSTTADIALFLNTSTTIELSGSSSINCTGSSTNSRKGIIANNALTIQNKAGESGELTVEAGESSSSSAYGMLAGESLIMKSGTVSFISGAASSGSCGVYTKNFTLDGGTLTATGGTVSTNGSMGMMAYGTVAVNGGSVIASCSTDLQSCALSFDAGEPTGNFSVVGGTTFGATEALQRISSGKYVLASDGNTAAQYAKISTGNTVTLTVNKDGAAWSGHGKTFALYQNSTSQYTGTGANGTVTFSGVADGTYDIYEGSVDTGEDVTVNSAAVTATLNYYTVSYTVQNSGAAAGSTISATYDSASVNSGAVVLGGKTLVVTAAGAGASTYTYAWSGTGTSSETTATLTKNNLAAAVNATCTVTGSAASAKTLSSIAVTTPPAKTVYAAGESFRATPHRAVFWDGRIAQTAHTA